MTSRTNPTCISCRTAHNAVNGRYCHILRRYVEHDRQPACRKE